MIAKLFFKNTWHKSATREIEFDNQDKLFDFIQGYNLINPKAKINRFLIPLGERIKFETNDTPSNLFSPSKVDTFSCDVELIDNSTKRITLPFLSVTGTNNAIMEPIIKKIARFKKLLKVSIKKVV